MALIDWEAGGVFYAAYDIATYFLGLVFTGKRVGLHHLCQVSIVSRISCKN